MQELILDDPHARRRWQHPRAAFLERFQDVPVDKLVFERHDPCQLRQASQRRGVVPAAVEHDALGSEARGGRVRKTLGDDGVQAERAGRLEGHPPELAAAQDAQRAHIRHPSRSEP